MLDRTSLRAISVNLVDKAWHRAMLATQKMAMGIQECFLRIRDKVRHSPRTKLALRRSRRNLEKGVSRSARIEAKTATG